MMSISWNEIVAIYQSQPWWVWPLGMLAIWFAAKWLRQRCISYVERPVITADGFRQCGVQVDFAAGTITLPRGDSYPVSYVRGLRWEDYSTAGKYRAYIDVDDLERPLHPVFFSTADAPEAFVARLRSTIEKAGGPRFAASGADRFDIIERDLSDPVTAAVATRVAGQGRRVSYARVG
ncbi:MAG: hypothetical protein KDK08_08735 [Rhizobiaceae bacterium]|nr:hypothetical protein [Rhizobiaceae bacterium]